AAAGYRPTLPAAYGDQTVRQSAPVSGRPRAEAFRSQSPADPRSQGKEAVVTALSASSKVRELPVPGFYDPARTREWSYAPDQHALFLAAQEWRREHAVRPTGQDRTRTQLPLLDLHTDFS